MAIATEELFLRATARTNRCGTGFVDTPWSEKGIIDHPDPNRINGAGCLPYGVPAKAERLNDRFWRARRDARRDIVIDGNVVV